MDAVSLPPCAPLPVELPLHGASPRERADAARNRRKVLAAAERLFAERGVEGVSMDAVAAAAGVGKGTLFRRFGDRASLARALLSEREAEFQETLIRGPAPLGPGAPPRERLIAFACGMLRLLEAHGALIEASEGGQPRARFRGGVYAFYRTHVTHLLREADPALDAELMADALLAALGGQLFHYLRADRGMSLERLQQGFETLLDRLLPPSAATACAGRTAGRPFHALTRCGPRS